MLPVKLVTFDVTGTLLFFRTPIVEKYVEVGSKFGVKADPKVLGENFKTCWKRLNKEHPNFGRETGLEWKNWWKLFVEGTFGGYIQPQEKTKISGILEELIDFHKTKEAFEKRPGTDSLLEFLKAKGAHLGVISNYDPRLRQILELVGLEKYFDTVLISYEFGYGKPDVRIFQEALKRGGCNTGQEAVHVGDDLELDYLAAKAAGFRSVLISTNQTHLQNEKVIRDEVFEDFSKLQASFQNLNFST